MDFRMGIPMSEVLAGADKSSLCRNDQIRALQKVGIQQGYGSIQPRKGTKIAQRLELM
jgi:hypothetical protein